VDVAKISNKITRKREHIPVKVGWKIKEYIVVQTWKSTLFAKHLMSTETIGDAGANLPLTAAS
jgi:hypothetical protein